MCRNTVGSMRRISDAITSHSQSTHSAMDEWMLADYLFNWDKVMDHIHKRVLSVTQTGSSIRLG